MSNYRKGSAGYAEDKEKRTMCIIFGIITFAVLLATFFLPTDLHRFMHRASGIANFFGAVLIICSWLVLVAGSIKDWNGYGVAISWLLLLGFGLCLSCGFNFDYFGLK
jgi:hypothetical protein